MSCFDNNRPKISSSEHIKNKRAKTIYAAVQPQVEKLYDEAEYDDDRATNYNGKIVFDACGNLVSTRTHGLRKDLARGYALCSDCNGFGMEGYGKVTNGNIKHTVMNSDHIPGSTIEYWSGGASVEDSLNKNGGNSTYQGEFIEIDPLVGLVIPKIILNKVDLPDPFGPLICKDSPVFNEKLKL